LEILKEEIEEMSVQLPWRQSQKGSVYCMWDNAPDDIKLQLKQEDGFRIALGEFHYTIKRNEDGSCVVFRNTKAEIESWKIQHSKKLAYRTIEVQVLSIEDANKLLAASNRYELLGTDPIKAVNGQFFAIVGKKEKV
jgi:hypothetical protein